MEPDSNRQDPAAGAAAAEDASARSSAPHVRPPKQDRSRRTLDRICQAALELMAEQGVEATTVKDIVQRAGSSVGSFYARFPGKDEFLLYLRDRTWQDAIERWDANLAERDWEAMELEEVAEEVVKILLESHREDRGRRRALGWITGTGTETGTDAGDDDPARLFHRHVLRDLRRLLLERSREITHPDPRLGVDLGYRMTLGAVRELAGISDERVDEELLVEEIARAYIAYLGVGHLPARDVTEGDADFGDPFDVWG